jgi:hypothetical protein
MSPWRQRMILSGYWAPVHSQPLLQNQQTHRSGREALAAESCSAHLCRCTRRTPAHWPCFCPRLRAGCPDGIPAGNTWPGRPRNGASRPCTQSVRCRRPRRTRTPSRQPGTRMASGSCGSPSPPRRPAQQHRAERQGPHSRSYPDIKHHFGWTHPSSLLLKGPKQWQRM